jgi:preprotein translocase subunit SecB
MADPTPASNGAAETDPNAPQFIPQAVYIKDLSFEAPNGPRLITQGTPTINLNLNTTINDLGGELREVVLSVNLQAQVVDKTVWLIEMQQAGAFAVRNIPQLDLQRLLGIFCPAYLLPYARQTVSDLLLKGGFPPFLIPPVNFEMLFDQAVARAQLDAAGTQAPPAVN